MNIQKDKHYRFRMEEKTSEEEIKEIKSAWKKKAKRANR